MPSGVFLHNKPVVNCYSIRQIAERWFLPTSLETKWLLVFCGYDCLCISRHQGFVVSFLTSEFWELKVYKVKSLSLVFSFQSLRKLFIYATAVRIVSD